MFPKIQTASKLECFLAKSFGKINTSEDSGIVTVVSKWRGKYYVLSQTHAQQSVQRMGLLARIGQWFGAIARR